MELYNKHRPKTLDEVVGQNSTVSVLKSFIAKKNLPHALLLSGPSGCGKTTICRILGKMLKCSRLDYNETNCASIRGIDFVRDIQRSARLAPMGGARVYALDECHQLTNEAQSALLKTLEDTQGSKSYFFLCTTHPTKLIPTVRNRTTQLQLGEIAEEEAIMYLRKIADMEKVKLHPAEAVAIVRACSGSMRSAMVLLEKLIQIPYSMDRIKVIDEACVETQIIDIARMICGFKKCTWKDVSEILRNMQGDAESARRVILGYAQSILLKTSGKPADKSAAIINAFRDNLYDCGMPGFTAICYELVHEL